MKIFKEVSRLMRKLGLYLTPENINYMDKEYKYILLHLGSNGYFGGGNTQGELIELMNDKLEYYEQMEEESKK